jgi:MFS transporter, DHA2 family, multidrug resistance protein
VAREERGPAPIALPLGRASRLVATGSLMLASAMQAADATIANVALPQLERDLGGGVVLGAWVVTSYLCATAVVAPLTGWLRRRFGTRRLFVGAVVAFTVASLLCSLAPTAPAIIFFRVLQGAGGGVIHPLAQAILLDLYPREQHGRMLAYWGATVMLGPIIGPALGGIITDLASWRWVFAINLPLGAVAIWGMRRALANPEATAHVPFDFLGVLLLSIGVGALQLSLSRGVGQSWLESPELIIESVIVVIAFVGVALRAQGTSFAAIRFAVFRDINFAAGVGYNFVSSALLFVTIVFIPALCQGPLGYSATVAGMTIVPRGIATMLMMLLIGKLLEIIDFRILLACGIMLTVVGLLMLSAARPPDALAWLVIGSTLQSVGGGGLLTCFSMISFSTLAPEMRTDASGVYSLLRQLGCASGVALMTGVLHVIATGYLLAMSEGPPGPGEVLSPENLAILRAYSACFQGMAVAALFMLPGIWLFRTRPVRPAVVDPV